MTTSLGLGSKDPPMQVTEAEERGTSKPLQPEYWQPLQNALV